MSQEGLKLLMNEIRTNEVYEEQADVAAKKLKK